MKKFPLQNGGVKKGSALLITLLLLGILMTLTLGISTLVIREIRVTQSIVDANKAYYSAEAGVERALLALSKNLAGYEPKGEYSVGSGGGSGSEMGDSDDFSKIDPNFAYVFSTGNQTDSVPGFSDDKPIFMEKIAVSGEDGELLADCQLSSASNPFALAYTKNQIYENCQRATFRKLALNETHIIPLYSTVSDGGGVTTVSVNDFLIQYYLNIRDGSALFGDFQGLKLESLDVLRWKIYGKPLVDSGVQRTESIADFYPGITNNGPNSPVCIGTSTKGFNSNLKVENCLFPSLSKKPPTPESLGSGEELTDLTLWSAARECYQTDAGAAVTGGALIKGTTQGDPTGCQMRDFIDNHKENYLILTNMVNPNVVGIANLKDPAQLARADIYYRVIARSDSEDAPKLVKDFAEITSYGFAGAGKSVIKTLNVFYKAPGFLPVFNFSLYKTKES